MLIFCTHRIFSWLVFDKGSNGRFDFFDGLFVFQLRVELIVELVVLQVTFCDGSHEWVVAEVDFIGIDLGFGGVCA